MTKKCLPPVNLAIKDALARKGVTYAEAATAIRISPRQFGRQIRGESKDVIVPPETVRDLYEASLIEKETADMWFDSARTVYRIKGPLVIKLLRTFSTNKKDRFRRAALNGK